MQTRSFLRIAALGVLALAGSAAALLNAPAGEQPKKSLVVGVIAKSQSNPVFIAARTGAEDAARDLSKKYGIEIKANWQTPVSEDAQKQAQYIEQLVSQGVDGIAISCTDGQVLQKPIDDAVSKGVTVVTFDSDSPNSKRMAYYGINDVDAGRAVMRELAKAMGEKGGKVAILGGNQTAPNLQARIKGVKEELEKLADKGFTLDKVYYHKETANDAAAELQRVQTTNPDIAGWAMVGGWPLFTQNALDGVYDKAKVASVDTLPEELEYVKKGQVQALVGQDCYGWGYESVRMIVEKLVEKKTPAKPINNFELKIVTQANVAEVEGTWQKWLGKKSDARK
ncbi:MAG: substrate-binding domain-containing protein [Phycisphaerales bacterium]|nr:substrate-binding domain-containing protein [Phycisphaerales bacterium]